MLNKSIKVLFVISKLFISVIFFYYTGTYSYGEEEKFERISVERGLAHGSVYSIIQDKEGYLWFATGDGLNRYDGYEFKVFRHDPSDHDSLISGKLGDIFQDSRGIIWIGTWGAGLDRFDPEKNTFIHIEPDPNDRDMISNGRVEDIEEDMNGYIWAGMEQEGLIRYDPVSQKFKFYKNDPDNPNSLVDNDVKVLYLDKEGDLWIGTNGGLSRLTIEKNGKERFVNYFKIPGDQKSLSSNKIRALCADSEGKIWIGTKGGGISILDPNMEKTAFRHIRFKPGDKGSISENSIATLMLDSRGYIWVGTYNSGLNRYREKDGKITRFYHDSRNSFSLSHNRSEALLEDRSGILWIGTLGGGANKLDLKEKKFRNYTYNSSDKNSLPHPSVRSICQMGEDLVIGTEDGIALFNSKSNRYTHLRKDQGDINSLSGNRVWSVLIDRNRALWAGTFSNGLNRIIFKNGKTNVTRFLHDPLDNNSLSNERVQVVFEDNEGDIWAGTPDGLNLLKGSGRNLRFQRFLVNGERDRNTFYGNNYIVSVFQDNSGMLWIGTRGGLVRLDKKTGKYNIYRHDPENNNSLGSNSILAISESIRNTGVLWIGTADSGLSRFDIKTGNFERYYEKDGLPGNEVNGILQDEKGFLWLSTNGGLSKFDPDNKKFRNYKKSSGIEGIGFIRNSSFKKGNGEMFFGSISGMVSFFPGKVKDNPNVPDIGITSFSKLGEEVELKKSAGIFDEIRLAYDENFITIDYSALDFTNVKENRYSYYLEGVDYNWITAESGRSVSYNHLQPGRYRFHVKGSNNDGIWNEEGVLLRIKIVPAFWQTLWFRNFLIILAALIIVGIYKFRVTNITRRNKQLSEFNVNLNKEIENRISAEEALRESELSYKTLFLNANDSIFLLREGVFTKCNEKTPGIFGFTNEEGVIGKSIMQFSSDFQSEGKESSHFNTFIEMAMSGEPQRFNWIFIKKDGTPLDTEISLNKLEIGKEQFIQVIMRDITEQKKMQERLSVTQKMESIGELTGGIAHDFNNILTAMNGYAELALGNLEPEKKGYRFVSNILKSGNQAVDLVQKLLGFSRQQIIAPRVTNINRTIPELNDMLVRIIGEDIEIEYILKEDIRPIKADLTQIKQIIINLIINSRDAVNHVDRNGNGKKIVIETDEIVIGSNFVKSHSGAKEGKHIVISVSDNGIGISRKVQEKIFEPFFTTKGLGKGTGLGLSTVYGIVKQNGGSIYVYSEVGEGTTVKIYWPVSEDGNITETPTTEALDVTGGNETIIFVEDDEAVRDLSTTILENLGYKVHSASNGAEAITLIESGVVKIDLLITDVIMPKMGGKELAVIAKKLIPGLKVLFASGYTDNYIVHSGVLEKGVNFIQKPYSIKSIGNKIREVLSE